MSRRPEVKFIQTSDPYVYYEMLSHTSKTVKAFCRGNDYAYEAYIGVKRGRLPWQATYNRIYMLMDLVLLDYRGWVVYLDADAFIPDQRFDLDRLLAEHASRAAILALAGEPQDWWDINAGVMLLNLGHVAARSLIRRWKHLLDQAPESVFSEAGVWAPGVDDQSLLQIALRQRPRIREQISFASLDTINSPQASFLRQFIRVMGSVEERTALIAREVSAILEGAPC